METVTLSYTSRLDYERYMKGLLKKDRHIISLIYNKYFDCIQKLILQNSGTIEDAKDVFQEALLSIFQRLQKNGNVDYDCSFKTLLYSICRNIWLIYLKKKKIEISRLKDHQFYIEFNLQSSFEPEIYQTLEYKLFQKHIVRLNEDCKKIFYLFSIGYTVKEMCLKLGFQNQASLIKRKHKCKKQLLDRILKDSEYKMYSE